MKRNQLNFFATKADLESLLRAVESQRQLQYVVAGMFDSPDIVAVSSLLDNPNLGQTTVGDAMQTVCYVVTSREAAIEVRPVPQRRGGIRYAIDQAVNPATITLRPGGAYGNICLLAGQMGTISEDPSSLNLYRAFSKEARKQFEKIGPYYVGKEAAELLDKGWRLTTGVKSPTLYDLRRE